MIQRKQTIYLLLVVILTVVCMSSQVATMVSDSGKAFADMYNLWLTDGQGHHSFRSAPLFVCLLLSALLTIVTIFMYQNRKRQALMCIGNMVLLVMWYILLAVQPQFIGGMMHLEWPAVLPAVGIILLFMARKGILADEKLVRSLDRIR
jgi:hypothetical protein